MNREEVADKLADKCEVLIKMLNNKPENPTEFWEALAGVEVYLERYMDLMNRDAKLKMFARKWLNGPLPADLMADLADIVEDEDYTPEKRAHQVVWQAIKWGLENG